MHGRHKHTVGKNLLHPVESVVIICRHMNGHSGWIIVMIPDIPSDRFDTQVDIPIREVGLRLIRVGCFSAKTQLNADSVRFELRTPFIQCMHKRLLVTEEHSVCKVEHLVVLRMVIVGMNDSKSAHHSHMVWVVENEMAHIRDRIEHDNILLPVIVEILSRERLVTVIIPNGVVIPDVGIACAIR